MKLSAAILTLAFLLNASEAYPGGHVRQPVDTVGYATTAAQMERVISLAGPAGEEPVPGIIGGICPHDDYIYAAPVYARLMRNVDVPLVILIGVSHKARRQGIQGRLVFDTFEGWRGPYGDIPVSPVREGLIGSLPEELVLVSDDLHAGEHSIEGLIPFLQHYRSDRGALDIVPVLVTRLAGESFEKAVGLLAGALHAQLEDRGMVLGRDAVVLVSADCVHYGDEGWGGRDYAPFGVDEKGYRLGVRQDIDIAEATLAGEFDRARIKAFRDRVDSYMFEWPYKIPWCGVYSIPFGVSLLAGLCELEGRDPPEGKLLEYSTSMERRLDGLEEAGLGETNVATLRHWVGYAAIGYW